ncbi:MAG: 5-amino-6-(D-ribitylamino)uracil--L-tyrosine 4-hydroxyphenyl transferase CofH [Verrucomicrobiota bacterium]
MKRQTVTYSPSLTITLTHDCPWHCRYCGFRSDSDGLISDQNIESKLEQAVRLGVREVLLISGERPNTLPHIRRELRRRGYTDFIDFACSVAERAVAAGLLPHGNYGAMGRKDFERCRTSHVSMGVMLENIEDAPETAPEKRALSRLSTIRNAGEAKVPFTSGILIGLGESRESRFRSLDTLAALHDEFGHLQEIIIQNFIPNEGSALRLSPNAPDLVDYQELIRYWKEICPEVSVQVPPNVNPYWEILLPELTDIGGISPERDEVNPQSPWQELDAYRSRARAHGVELRERLAVYNHFLTSEWVDESLLAMVEDSGWEMPVPEPVLLLPEFSCIAAARNVQMEDFWTDSTEDLIMRADELRQRRFGKRVTYVTNRNANFTNVCNVGCSFCGFARKASDSDAYTHPAEAIAEKLLGTPGITEVCLQGGIHPRLGFEYYLELLRTIRETLPQIHIHAFSPMEIHAMHRSSGKPYGEVLEALRDAGLDTIPGTAAEILVDEVRRQISGNKLSSAQWETIIRTAHGLGLKSTATIMYGHVETWDHIRTHFEILKQIQLDTGGFTELVPLSFIPYQNRLGSKICLDGFEAHGQQSRMRAMRLYPLARVFFDELIPHLQTSWVKLGVAGAVESLRWGCDDFGGTLFEESITRESGGCHGEVMLPETIREVVERHGFECRERTTLYHVSASKTLTGCGT